MNEKSKLWIYALKGFGIGAIALILKALVSFAILLYYSGENLIGDIPNYAIHIVCFVASIFIYNSVFGIFMTFDKSSLNDFTLNDKPNSPFKNAFCHKNILVEGIAIIAFTSLAAALGASREIGGMFYFDDGVSPYSNGIIPFSVTAVITFLLFLLTRYEATRYWLVLKRQGAIDETITMKRLIIRLIIIAIAYPLAFPFMPLIAFVFITLFRTAVTIVSAPLLLLTIFLLIAVLLTLKLLFVIKKRKNFINNLKTTVRQHGFTLSEIENPYASLFNLKKQCSFTVTNKKTTYDCVVLGHLLKSVPICFTSDSEGYFRYRLGTKRHNVTMQKHFEFFKKGSGVKILIINPTPKYAYICDTESDNEKRLFNADKLWDYVAYEAEAFIGALDRDCLGKCSSVSESKDVHVPRLPNIHL